MPKQIEVTGTIENWRAVNYNGSNTMAITGDLHNDILHRWKEGYNITTSYFPIREVAEGDVIRTRNNSYLLGKELTCQTY